jgi:ketopantoate reductase
MPSRRAVPIFRAKKYSVGCSTGISEGGVPAMIFATIRAPTRSRAGTIARSASGAEFVSAVIDERARVCAAEGFSVPTQIEGLVRGMYAQVGSTYGPSILIDVEEGRATEEEHTIGDLVERAGLQHIQVQGVKLRDLYQPTNILTLSEI